MSSRNDSENDAAKSPGGLPTDASGNGRSLRVLQTPVKPEVIHSDDSFTGLPANAPNDTEVQHNEIAPKKKKKKTKTTNAKTATDARQTEARGIRGNRGVDTLLRNSYRAQLDMLALAATKANIMISLNGLLMSMLIISGTHLVSINGLYVIPIAIFLVTCAVATTFAVFAARPEISRSKYHYHDFVRDEAHLLSFEEFADLRESEYVEIMSDMLQDQQRVYRNMIAHIHELGVTADRKYRNLYYSYNAFMAGTIVTVLSLLTLVGLRWSGVATLV